MICRSTMCCRSSARGAGRSFARCFRALPHCEGDEQDAASAADLGPVTQTLAYSGEPRVIARFDIDALVRLAQSANAVRVDRMRRWRHAGRGHACCCACMARRRSCRAGADAGRSSRDDAHLRAGSEIRHSPAGRYRHPGIVAGGQRPDDGGAGARSDRGSAAQAWAQATRCRLCPRRRPARFG